MRMDGFADIRRFAAHLDCEADLADEIARMRSDDPPTDDAMGRRVEQQFGEALIAAVSDGAAGGRPGKDRLSELDALALAFVLRLAGPGDFGIGIGHRRNLPRVEI